MVKVWVVIDVCFECRVGTEPVGIYRDETAARTAAAQRNVATGAWRDGGQTQAKVFERALP